MDMLRHELGGPGPLHRTGHLTCHGSVWGKTLGTSEIGTRICEVLLRANILLIDSFSFTLFGLGTFSTYISIRKRGHRDSVFSGKSKEVFKSLKRE